MRPRIEQVVDAPLHMRYTLWVEIWKRGELLGVRGYAGALYRADD